MKVDFSLNELSEVAQTVLKNSDSKVLLFYGKMGAGKTTLIKEMVKQLGVKDVTSSPTFSIVNEYLNDQNEPVYHFDFYRIENEGEAYQFGAEEYLDSGNWCLVEWPDKVQNLLPLDAVEIHLTVNENLTRTLEMN